MTFKRFERAAAAAIQEIGLGGKVYVIEDGSEVVEVVDTDGQKYVVPIDGDEPKRARVRPMVVEHIRQRTFLQKAS